MNIFSETHAFFPVQKRRPGRQAGEFDGAESVIWQRWKTPPLVLMALTESAAAVVVEVQSRSLNGQFSKSALPKKTTFPARCQLRPFL